MAQEPLSAEMQNQLRNHLRLASSAAAMGWELPSFADLHPRIVELTALTQVRPAPPVDWSKAKTVKDAVTARARHDLEAEAIKAVAADELIMAQMRLVQDVRAYAPGWIEQLCDKFTAAWDAFKDAQDAPRTIHGYSEPDELQAYQTYLRASSALHNVLAERLLIADGLGENVGPGNNTWWAVLAPPAREDNRLAVQYDDLLLELAESQSTLGVAGQWQLIHDLAATSPPSPDGKARGGVRMAKFEELDWRGEEWTFVRRSISTPQMTAKGDAAARQERMLQARAS